MPPALSLTTAHLPICKSQEVSKENTIKTPLRGGSPNQRALLDVNLGRRKLLKSAGLGLIGTGFAAARPTKAEPESPQESTSSRMSYSRFLRYLNEGAVKKVDLFENGTVAIAEISNPTLNKIQRVKVELPGLPQELLRKLKEKDVNFAAHPVEPNVGLSILDFLVNWGFPLLFLGLLFLRNSSVNTPGGPNLPFGLGRSKAKFQMEPNTGITFDDVAGVDEAKQDFKEIVEFLKSPEKFAAVGARIPKGVLLVGPPGTGKTLLAKAIAGEAGVPFFSLSGSEFIEMFVGVGASRVRDLFNKAKANSPCLVFIDEIDAVGRQRGTGIGGGNDEREQTLNQLLTEMDGFSGDSGVIVIAATNRPEILDSALLRPGRFDRQVTVGLPDVRGREEILKVHSSNKKLDKGVSLTVIAMRTPGFSGADLANLMNEAAILAGRRGKDKITAKEIDDSIDRIVAGLEGTKMTDGKSKMLVAYHEIGHAICATLTPGHDPVQKVTLIPRGQARGLTWFLPGEDPTLISKQQIFARIVGGLGGRATEEVVFGEPEVTTGAAGDLQQITQIAKQMVTMFGMSEIGPWALMDPAVRSGDVVLRMLARNSMSEKLAEDIDKAVKAIIDRAYEIAKTHIRNNRAAMDQLVEVLLEKETLTGDEFRAILSEFTDDEVDRSERQTQCLALLQSCSSMADLRQIHAHVIASGLLRRDKFLASELLRFCALSPSGSLPYARSLLAHSPDPSMRSSWNHLIRGYSQSDSPGDSLFLYLQMRRHGLRPNELTFPFVFKASAHLAALQLGRQAHADALKTGFDSIVYVQNTLMLFYGSCRKIKDARRVFDGMPLRTVVSWNTILSTYVDNLLPEESIAVFTQMRSCGFEPDQTTFVVLLSAAAELGSLRFGRWLHGDIIGRGSDINLQLGTALVNMYAKCGSVNYARRVFDRMPVKNVWTWSAMILGCAQHGSAKQALELFSEMKKASIEPNYVTFLGVLCACSHAGLVDDGYGFFHEMVHVHGIEPMMTHYSAMVDVLGRKGHLREACDFIRSMPVEPDAVVWRTLLSACQLHSSKDKTSIVEDVKRRLLKLEPRRTGNYVMVANMYSEAGSWDEAAKVRRMMREEGLKKVAGESCVELGGSIHRFISGDDSCLELEYVYEVLDGLHLNIKMIDCIGTNSFTNSIKKL
ncbi:ATP-dependent zinc metalloprotease FTSH 6, chloroplastic-like [Phoenix dactylifera]|uniref:ATP-dependent zinc metalloprotease FTSH 6, chloroplastic-like n=1 Tax=Phoenix dactylifera TaxID=42345 RepID=A0A8B7CMY1_PHODC|nr:ATP-dependent zinc metalloprotease FTSH 6, chloroplastic-like [Phoenix dactylifera]